MIKVCDAIMGSGKSSAAITYINAHPEKKFIYITPYLSEADRIAKSCTAKFYKPARIAEHHGSKIAHTAELVRAGKNITSTHQAFRMYPEELVDLIKEQKYTLIIDENVDTLDQLSVSSDDVDILTRSGYLTELPDGSLTLEGTKQYHGGFFSELFKLLKIRDIVKIEDPTNTSTLTSYYYWRFPVDFLDAFEDVFILTYLFEGQSLCYMLKMYNKDYSYIGINHPTPTHYEFSEADFTVPGYVNNLHNIIHICDHEKLNNIGGDKFALSMSWFDKPESDVEQLQCNVYNYFINLHRAEGTKRRLWASFECAKRALSGKGYTSGYLTFNAKAMNEFKDRDILAYCVNIFMPVSHKIFYQKHGLDVDEELYALSIMLQWMWRSAIREGKEIWVYIPSKRMRDLLTEWIEDTENNYYTYIKELVNA